MSNRDIIPNDWFNQFFTLPFGSRQRRQRRRGEELSSIWEATDMLSDFDYINDEMNRMFELFNNVSNNAPKELVREYETKEGGKVREVGPIVYGYSMTIGPDGKPKVREFGNVKSLKAATNVQNIGSQVGQGQGQQPQSQLSVEREPLVDVNTTDKEVKVILEMPGIRKEDIHIKAYDSQVEVTTSKDAQRKYHKNVELPEIANIETARSSYNNGILEITFDKKIASKPAGKEIKID